MNFEATEKIAAAILYEGYILYPYRPTAIKNRQRWNFGTLYPHIYAEQQRPAEPFSLTAECLAIAGADAALDVRISFLQLVPPQQAKSAELTDPSLAWDEAVERCSEQTNLRIHDLLASSFHQSIHIAADRLPEDRSENPRLDLQAVLIISAEQLGDGSCRLHLEVTNETPLPSGAAATRSEALPRSLVSAHVLLGIERGSFISLLDPEEPYSASAAACRNSGVFPVLTGEATDRSLLLCSPIILYDYPQIAPESEGDFFDGTEMDEMLTLRVLTLTDAEKQEMRDGDPRARKILERTESLTADSMLKAHGIIRSMRDIRRDIPGGAR
jgi:hypothetical protein